MIKWFTLHFIIGYINIFIIWDFDNDAQSDAVKSFISLLQFIKPVTLNLTSEPTGPPVEFMLQFYGFLFSLQPTTFRLVVFFPSYLTFSYILLFIICITYQFFFFSYVHTYRKSNKTYIFFFLFSSIILLIFAYNLFFYILIISCTSFICYYFRFMYGRQKPDSALLLYSLYLSILTLLICIHYIVDLMPVFEFICDFIGTVLLLSAHIIYHCNKIYLVLYSCIIYMYMYISTYLDIRNERNINLFIASFIGFIICFFLLNGFEYIYYFIIHIYKLCLPYNGIIISLVILYIIIYIIRKDIYKK